MKRKGLWFFILLFLFIYVNNTSLFVTPQKGKPLLLAHRGLAQTFRTDGMDNETNTAIRIYKPEHPYLENTIASMEAAFNCGADIVELDIHPTTDGQFAVFHDWRLDYRTNGTGPTEDHTLQELKTLDVGYGYTADSGKTFPFRGKGIGLIPSLDEVLNRFPQRSFLIHIKSDDPKVGEQLATFLKKLPADRLTLLSVHGGDKPVARFHELLPDVRATSKATVKKSLILYFAIGWTGYMPASLKNAQILLPQQYAPYLWGWPYRFLNRMKDANTRILLVKGDGKFSEGFDNVTDIKELPANYTGGIWTNRIDRIAPLFK